MTAETDPMMTLTPRFPSYVYVRKDGLVVADIRENPMMDSMGLIFGSTTGLRGKRYQ